MKMNKYILVFSFQNRPSEKVAVEADNNLAAILKGLKKIKAKKEEKVTNVDVTYL